MLERIDDYFRVFPFGKERQSDIATLLRDNKGSISEEKRNAYFKTLIFAPQFCLAFWEILKTLLEMGADLHSPELLSAMFFDKTGTLLENVVKEFKLQIDYKATVRGTNVLNLMVGLDSFPACLDFLPKQPKIDFNFQCPTTKLTPLHCVSKFLKGKPNFKTALEFLIEQKVDFDIEAEKGMLPLHLLLEVENIVTGRDTNGYNEEMEKAILPFLPHYLKKPDHIHPAVLYSQSSANKIKVLKVLIENKANLETRFKMFHDKPTWLEWALDGGRDDLVKLLLENKANIESKLDEIDDQKSNQPLSKSLLFNAVKKQKNNILELLYSHKPNVHIVDDKGKNAVHWVCQTDRKDNCKSPMVKTLLDFGSTRLLQNDIQRKENAKRLLETKDQNGDTPLHMLCYPKYLDTTFLDWFLGVHQKLGVNCQIQNNDGHNLLFKLIFELTKSKKEKPDDFANNLKLAIESIKILLKFGFDFFSEVEKSCNAYEFAKKLQLTEVVEFIESELADPKDVTMKEFRKKCQVSLLMGFKTPGCSLFKVAEQYPELKTTQYLGMMMEYAFPNAKHSYLDTRPLSCFESFAFMSKQEQDKLVNDFKDTMQNFDHALIVNTVVQALKSFRLDNVIPTIIFPDFKQDQPLKTLLMPQLEQKHSDFIIMALPTNQNKHSVGLVINIKRKEFFFYDSEGDQFGAQAEALAKVKDLIQKEPRFADYTIPELACDAAQQKDKESCGIFSAINIIAYILHESGVRINIAGRCKDLMGTLGIVEQGYPRTIKPKTDPKFLNIYIGGLLLAKQALDAEPAKLYKL